MSRGRLWLIMIVLMFVEALSALEVSMIYTAMPTISQHFGGDPRTGWLVSAFLLVQAGTGMVGGRLGDLYGRKRILIIVTAICAVGSLISATSTDLNLVVLGRALQGLSGAILPLAYGIARELAPRKETSFWIGCLTAGYQIGAALGYLLGGVLAEMGSWHSLFYFAAGYGLLTIAPLILLVPRTKPERPDAPFDYAGLAIIPAVAALLLGITQGGAWGWMAPGTWLAVGGGALGLLAWTVYQLRAKHPLFDVRSLGVREVLLGNIFFVLYGFGTAQMPLFLMFLIQQPAATGVGLGLAAAAAGVLKMPSSVAAIFAGPASGLVSARHGARAALIVSAFMAATAWLVFAFLGKSLWFIVGGSIISAFASAMLTTAVPILILSRTTVARSSEAVGMSIALKGIFFAIGTQVAMFVLNSSHVTVAGRTYPSPEAFTLCFSYVSAIAVVSVLVSLFVPRQAGRAQDRPNPAPEPKLAAAAGTQAE